MSVGKDTTFHARIVEGGVTTTRISSFAVEVPGTGEEISLDEVVKRGLVSEETDKRYGEEVTTDKTVEPMVVLIIGPETEDEIQSDEAVGRGRITHQTDRDTTKCLDRAIFLSSKAHKKCLLGKCKGVNPKSPNTRYF